MQIYGVLQFVGSFNIVANIISEELMYTNPANTTGYYYKYTYLQQVRSLQFHKKCKAKSQLKVTKC